MASILDIGQIKLEQARFYKSQSYMDSRNMHYGCHDQSCSTFIAWIS